MWGDACRTASHVTILNHALLACPEFAWISVRPCAGVLGLTKYMRSSGAVISLANTGEKEEGGSHSIGLTKYTWSNTVGEGDLALLVLLTAPKADEACILVH